MENGRVDLEAMTPAIFVLREQPIGSHVKSKCGRESVGGTKQLGLFVKAIKLHDSITKSGIGNLCARLEEYPSIIGTHV